MNSFERFLQAKTYQGSIMMVLGYLSSRKGVGGRERYGSLKDKFS